MYLGPIFYHQKYFSQTISKIFPVSTIVHTNTMYSVTRNSLPFPQAGAGMCSWKHFMRTCVLKRFPLGQLNMANMRSEYVKWLFLETFLHPNSKIVFVFALWHRKNDPTIFLRSIFFVLNLLCKNSSISSFLRKSDFWGPNIEVWVKSDRYFD